MQRCLRQIGIQMVLFVIDILLKCASHVYLHKILIISVYCREYFNISGILNIVFILIPGIICKIIFVNLADFLNVLGEAKYTDLHI